MAAEDKLLKLQQYQRTQQLIHDLNFEKAIQLPMAAGAEGANVPAHSRPSSSFIVRRIQDLMNKSDMSMVRDHLKVMSEIDPANPYYSNLLERLNHGERISWKEFENAVDRFSSSQYYLTKLQDAINDERVNAQLRGDLPEGDIAPSTDNIVNVPGTKEPETDSPPASPVNEPASSPSTGQPLRERQPLRIIQPRRLTKEEYGKYKEDHKEDRNKRAKELWDRRKAGVLKPKPVSSGWGIDPLTARAGKWLADKLGITKAAKAIANNITRPLMDALRNTRAWQAVAPRLQPLANLYNQIASPFRALNNALNMPGNWLNSQMGNFANWAGNGIRSLASNGIRAGMNQAGNIFNATRAYGGQIGAGASGVGAAAYYGTGILLAVLTSALFWVILAILVLFIYSLWSAYALMDSQCNQPEKAKMEVKKILGNPSSGSDQVRNGQRIDFVIETTYTWLCRTTNVESITVTDRIPEGLTYDADNPTAESAIGGVGDGPKGTYNPTTRTLTWTVTNIPANAPVDYYFSVTPTDTVNDSWVPNQATVTYKVSNQNGGSAGGKIINSSSQSFEQAVAGAAQNVNMPPALLKAILSVEASGVFEYSEEEFRRFSTPGWWESADEASLKRGYAYNTCATSGFNCGGSGDVQGVAQFLSTTWDSIAPEVEKLSDHKVDRRNATDAIYGSAIYNKQNAVLYTGSPNVEWTEDVVRAVARMYCAGPGAAKNPAAIRDKNCGWDGKYGYDDFVWRNYQQFSGAQ